MLRVTNQAEFQDQSASERGCAALPRPRQPLFLRCRRHRAQIRPYRANTVMQDSVPREARVAAARVSINFTTVSHPFHPFPLSISPPSLPPSLPSFLSYTLAPCTRLYYKLNRRVLRSSNEISTSARLETRRRGGDEASR